MPMFTATRVQVVTYLLGVCPFSIAFLVFLNSSVSFVITDLIGRDHAVGDAVGNLGFADELVALIACPFWGLLSDRIGVRAVCVLGYAIVCLSLILFVQAKDVYPQLLLGRLFFSVGGAAASTMVTAVLPAMSFVEKPGAVSSRARHAQAASITSELTITPDRYRSSAAEGRGTGPKQSVDSDTAASTSRIAGFVGMFTGFGALLALFVFLPLPAAFQRRSVAPGSALQYSYYIVASIAAVLSIVCFFGLRSLKSEEGKSWRGLLKGRSTSSNQGTNIRQVALEVLTSLRQALVAGVRSPDIGMGYLGGFVARASSVGISLFIPLLVNALFTSSGLCTTSSTFDTPAGLPDIKRRCPRAYIVASELTGASQMVALITAPLFGYWSARTQRKSLPLATSALAGIIGYPLFATQFDPHDDNRQARIVAFIAACLIGFSQIGAIVCSLASLGCGVLVDSAKELKKPTLSSVEVQDRDDSETAEDQPLIGATQDQDQLSDLKGSVAGVYSFYGGAAILILTKAGGKMFDTVSTGAPFYIMASFNGALLLASVAAGVLGSASSTSD